MDWPYHLVNLDETQRHQRRILLDRYGVYAQLSSLVPILAFQLCLLGKWVFHERARLYEAYSTIPSSPVRKQLGRSSSGSIARLWKLTVWYLNGEIAEGWGLRLHWLACSSWMIWLLFLCVHETGDDYLHITKRFGVVAASQFPLHYMLSMKSRFSPLAFAFRTSHEHLNPWHRQLGRIIFSLLSLHATWYMNFFVQAQVLYERLTTYFVIIGIAAFILLTVMVMTSLEKVRRWNYRVFFILHLLIGVLILPLIFFHAKPLRFYVLESLALFIFDITCRRIDTITALATITSLSHTDLVMLKIPMPPSKMQKFHSSPGSHVYLSIPSKSILPKSSALHGFLFNPFTVADVSATEITLILRTLQGPTTKALQRLAGMAKPRHQIAVEGPLGASIRLCKLARKFDRVLLVAGGVGGTYVLPIYHALKEQFDAEVKGSGRIDFNWSVRSTADLSWTADLGGERDIQNDENVQVFVTQDHPDAAHPVDVGQSSSDKGVELDELDITKAPLASASGRGRPNLSKIVDSVFRLGNEERVMVLFCGPQEMGRELRGHVSRWVVKGRDVWWHNESFGW